MRNTSQSRKMEIFVRSMEEVTLESSIWDFRFQHETRGTITDPRHKVVKMKKSFSEKDREALEMAERYAKTKNLDVRIYDLSTNYKSRFIALFRGVFSTPVIFVDGKKVESPTKDEIDKTLAS